MKHQTGKNLFCIILIIFAFSFCYYKDYVETKNVQKPVVIKVIDKKEKIDYYNKASKYFEKYETLSESVNTLPFLQGHIIDTVLDCESKITENRIILKELDEKSIALSRQIKIYETYYNYFFYKMGIKVY